MTGRLAMFNLAARGVRHFTAGLIAIAGLLFCLALAGLTVDIFMRVAFDSSIRGMQEIVTDLFLYAFFLGAAALYARNEDVALTFFLRPLPVRARAVLGFLVALVVAACMALVCFEAASLTIEQRSMFSPELGIPESVRLAPLAFAAASIACTSLVDAWSYAVWALDGTRPSVWDAPASPD
jgi:TRAP-type C4-dicarboxylate transport system permease small subunit